MKIGIDARMIEFSGIGVRIQNLLKFYPDLSDVQYYVFGEIETLKKYKIPLNSVLVEYKANIYSVQEMLGHPQMKEMDILDIPHFNIPIYYLNKCIITIHDIIPYKMKQYYQSISKQVYIKIIMNIIRLFARKIISVSMYTKNDLIKEFGFHSEQIEVVHNAVDKDVFKKLDSNEIYEFRKKYNLPDQFLLMVGIGKEHKNHKFVIENLKKFWQNNELMIPLVLSGAKGKIPDFLIKSIQEIESHIVSLPQLTNEEMSLLYNSATLLIYPSLYEGFGFPPIEAQSCGCPVLSSSYSVMPEILGNSVHYFHPEDPADFQQEFKELMQSDRLNSRIEAGYMNIRRYEWKESASKQLSIIKGSINA